MKKSVLEKINKEADKLRKSGQVYDSKKWISENGFCNTVDIVLMSVIDNELGVLLIKRENKKDNPFGGNWALPGGYVDGSKDLDALAAAKRELEEETGLKDIYLEQLYTFTSKNRDPREAIANSAMRTWSVAHFALIDYTKVSAIAGSDAEDVKWVKISELNSHDVAFDHEEIIDMAVERVRGKMNYSNVGFELVPSKFTIPELQTIFEHVLSEKLDRNNFRTKMLKLGILVKLSATKKEGPGQPAPYYKLDREKLKKLKGRSLF